MTYVKNLSREALESEWDDLHNDVSDYKMRLIIIGKAMDTAQSCPVCNSGLLLNNGLLVHREGCSVWEAILMYRRSLQD